MNKYSFLIKCTDGTIILTANWGTDYKEARYYFEKGLNKEWSLITDSVFIQNYIAKENQTRDDNPLTQEFFENLDRLESQENEKGIVLQDVIEIKRYTEGVRWEDTPFERIPLYYFSHESFGEIAYDAVKEISEAEQNEIRWNKKGLSNGHYVGSQHKFRKYFEKNKKN
ncbi:hypothetical protein [Bacillus phage vB_BanS-Thrax3]|nr:hypothetical protein [Bacillus phage vB_BanS-Thrax3]